MKKQILFFSALMTASLMAFAQEDQAKDVDVPLPNRVFKMNPWEFIDHTFFVEIEKLNPQHNESWNFGMGFKTGVDWSGDEEIGGKFELSKRFYLKGVEAFYPKKDQNPYAFGVFVAFFARGVYTHKTQEYEIYDVTNDLWTTEDNDRQVTSVFPGVMLGVTRSFWDVLYIEAYIGGGVRYAFVNDSNSSVSPPEYYDLYEEEYRGVAPNIGMKIGVAF